MEQLITYTQHTLISIGISPEATFLGNTALQYASAIVVFILASIAFGLLQKFALSWLANIAERTKTDYDDTFVKIVRSFRPALFFFFAFWLATNLLTLSGIIGGVINTILVLWLVYQAVIITGIVVEEIVFRHIAKDRDPTTKGAMRLIAGIAQGIMWVFGILLALSNFGIDITSLLAGAGIVGIAIAFALQGVLSDLFSAFSIYFDKPFRVGDFIIVGDTLGTVQHIGIKSTRIKALSGEMVVLSNQELVSARVQNFKLMEERRVVFSFGILYETPLEHIKVVPNMVQNIIESIEGTRFDRAHFKAFGESSLNFEVVYYMLDSDYTKYMDAQQTINLAIMEQFAEKHIGFAYPTRTLYTKKVA
jgi:small-conductance mechanosensitive channel